MVSPTPHEVRVVDRQANVDIAERQEGLPGPADPRPLLTDNDNGWREVATNRGIANVKNTGRVGDRNPSVR